MSTITITLTAEPPIEGKATTGRYGYDGRYRLYSVAHLPYDALPAYADGGPAKVTADAWSVSFSSMCRALSSPGAIAENDGMTTLNLSPVDRTQPPHPLNQSKHASYEAAQRAAYDAGAIVFMVYERQAAQWGLPSTPVA